ncbi:Ig domain-containing protein [Rhizobium sp. BK176]|uniref:beta strand repeat-containing protein n=1 Tax=Rhizobium sp. BK176 TaxID=2587071 RepID=UPI002167E180|nr:Ig domain-containing protein [Rhizobium sp. BK176]MCS4089173.1 hypothetical protein [Rhizobium sp. BK176]
MFKNLFASTVILFGSIAPSYAAMDPANGTYFFRYKSEDIKIDVDDNENQSKNITAFYAVGLDEDFSEKLPMKAQWANDNWVVTSGSLPDGISFDPATLTFSGKATKAVTNVVAKLTGYDDNNKEVATASANFDVIDLPSNTQTVDLYGHKGTYFFKQFSIPAGITVNEWSIRYPLPAGIKAVGPNLDGTPTEEVNSRYVIIGYDYLGEAVVAFKGNFTVDYASEFPPIADKLYDFDPKVDPYAVIFNKMAVTPIKQSLGSPAEVRYYVDVQNGGNLPGSLKVSNDALGRTISGSIKKHYDQATIRYRARDIDDHESISNWFKIGSLGPTPKCGVYEGQLPPSTIVGMAGTAISPYRVPFVDAAGTKEYVMTSGALPDGITFNTATGVFSGTPTKEEKQADINVDIRVTNNGTTDVGHCGPYDFDIQPAKFGLSYAITERDIRKGETIDATLNPGGGLLGNWSIALNDPSSLPAGISYAGGQSLAVKGQVNTSGDYAPGFTLTNGDGRTSSTVVSFSVHDPLSIEDLPATLSLKKYDVMPSPYQVVYDKAAIIGSPKFEIVGSLPAAATFPAESLRIGANSGLILGGTTEAPGTYGPFKVKLTDEHGGLATSKDFNIEVLPRDNMVGKTTAPTFIINYADTKGQQPLTVTQPVLATNLAKTWSINKAVPDGLSFDQDTGIITGLAKTKGEYDGYVISVSDTDGGSVSSEPFTISVIEPPAPTAGRVASIATNVAGAIKRTVASEPLRFDEKTLVGGISAVKYVDYTPAIAGLKFDTTSGTISGVPTEEFHGDVNINFTDGNGRPGVAPLRFDIYPYPEVVVNPTYELPRLSGSTIKVSANEGFFGGVTYSLSPNSAALPTDLSVTASGQIDGTTKDAIGDFPGIVIRGKDGATGIVVDSAPFTLKIVKQVPLALKTNTPKVTYSLNDKTFTPVSSTSFWLSTDGSYVAPLAYTLVNAPNGLTGVDAGTGRLTGAPDSLGEWTVTATAIDAEGVQATPVDFTVKATLDGYVQTTPVAQSPSDVLPGAKATLRKGETFQTATEVPSNHVGTVTFTGAGNPSTLPLVDPNLGVFRGYIDAIGTTNWTATVKDSDGRGYASNGHLSFSAGVIAPLALSLTQTTFTAAQYSASKPVSIAFPKASNAIGTISYGISGDLPGQLYTTNGNGVWTHYNADNTKVTVTSATQLPDDALVFNTVNATLQGIPSSAGTFDNLFITASDDHADRYIQNDSTRAAYNSATAGPFKIVVDATGFQITSTANPKQVIVPDGNATVTLGVVNNAYGKGVTWTAGASTLPTGITYAINGNKVDFSGYWTTYGTYSIAFSAKDALGRTTSGTQSFKVILSSQPIDLNVYAITSKVGFPIKMEPPFASNVLSTGNDFGTLLFTSSDAASRGLGVDRDTGAISGSLSATQSFTFNLSVTDDTNRITSKPVTVNVIPALRVLYPSLITVTQGTANTTVPDTAYNIGAVTYELAAGQTLPAGLSINPATGGLIGTPSGATGQFDNFVVYGVDAAGDRQPSNTFSIQVKPINARPVISNISGNKLAFGTVGVPFSFTPTVKDSVKSAAWTYPANYTINKDLTGTGLSFDTTTGVISGTPTTPVYFTDMVIGVSNDTGSSQTAAFIFGIQPSTAMSGAAGQVTSYAYRVGDVVSIPAPVFNNTWGTITYTATPRPAGTTMSTAGVLSGTTTAAGTSNVVTTVTDVFGRTATFTYTVVVRAALTIKVSSPATLIEQGTAYSAINLPTVTNAGGTTKFDVVGLPAPLTFSTSTGAISGNIPVNTYANGATFPVEVTVTDTTDGKTATATYTLNVANTFAAATGQALTVTVRSGQPYTFPKPAFNNGVGTVTYTGKYYIAAGGSQLNGSIDSDGIITIDPVSVASTGYVIITAKDALGRTATLQHNMTVMAAMTISAVPLGLQEGVAVSNQDQLTVTNEYGASTYSYSGLPQGMTWNTSTGALSGTPATGLASGSQTYPVTVSITNYGNTVSTTFNVVVSAQPGHRYWKIIFGQAVQPTVREVYFRNGNTAFVATSCTNAGLCNLNTSGYITVSTATGTVASRSFTFTFPTPIVPDNIVFERGISTVAVSFNVLWSDDNVNFTQMNTVPTSVGSGTYSIPN